VTRPLHATPVNPASLSTVALAAAVALALTRPALASAAAGPTPHREVLPGGLELVVAPIPGAATSSLRFLVRSGSLRDPPGREGMAHLLEHLLIRGAPGTVGLVEAARAAGATLNAFTSHETTTYVLDAPTGTFGPLAEGLLRAVTNPTLPTAQIEKELQVVSEEGREQRLGMFAFLENVLYRSDLPSGTTLGHGASRERVSRTDLMSFFQQEYATSNSALVLTGDVTVESARQLLERAFLVPPALPEEYPPAAPPSPVLPVLEKVRAGRIAVMVGYALEPEDRPACQPLADLVWLRAYLELYVRQPITSSVEVGCITLRGADFLLALATAPSLDASELPDALERIMLGATTRPITERERRLLLQRRQRELDRRNQSSQELADDLADAEARLHDRDRASAEVVAPPPLSPGATQAVAKRSFLPERRVFLQLSPFEG